MNPLLWQKVILCTTAGFVVIANESRWKFQVNDVNRRQNCKLFVL